jgi:hypothetical protein
MFFFKFLIVICESKRGRGGKRAIEREKEREREIGEFTSKLGTAAWNIFGKRDGDKYRLGWLILC